MDFGSGPVKLDATMIDVIKERLNDGYIDATVGAIQDGQIVHIKDGPLTGLEAIFVREKKD